MNLNKNIIIDVINFNKILKNICIEKVNIFICLCMENI